MDLEAEIDRLYSLPLDEFIGARNALAKALRSKGKREQADDLKNLTKPNLPAWAVNQLWHGERAAFDRLLDAGAAARAAVVGKGAAGPSAAAEKREASRTLLTLAKELLSAAGHPNTQSTHQRISHTLDAAMALGPERLDPPLGRLTRDLEPQGFDVLAGLQLAAPPIATGKTKKPTKTSKRARTPAEPVPRPAKIAPDAAKKARREAQVLAARKKLDDNLAALAAAQKEAEQAAETLAESRREAAAAAKAASHAEKEAREAAQRSVAALEAETAAARTAKAADSAARKAESAAKAAQRRLDRYRN